MDNISEESLKDFTLSFFKNLGSQLEIKDDSVIVNKVPKEFESYLGKKSPYNIIFNRAHESESTELIAKGNFMLKSMQEYLEGQGQTQVLKINFPNPEDKIKNRFILKNCTVYNPTRKDYPAPITRFTFSTVLQYLNDKEQLSNPIYIKDENSIEFKENNYNISNGSPKEAPSPDIRKEYIIAKEVLKTKISPKLKEVQEVLKSKLKIELDRLEKHSQQLTLELEQEIERQKLQLAKLEEESKKNPEAVHKIERLKKSIILFEPELKRERILKEYNFLTKDESYKHSLNIINKLINTAIIYYPISLFNFRLASGRSRSKLIELRYDSFHDTISSILCESCNKQIIELSLCAGGHISCVNCLEECKNCSNKICKHCKIKVCSICTKNICEGCTSKCPLCFNYFCSKHMKKEKFTKKEACNICLTFCPECKGHIKKLDAKTCNSCKNKFCATCIKPIFTSGKISHLCPTCAKKGPK